MAILHKHKYPIGILSRAILIIGIVTFLLIPFSSVSIASEEIVITEVWNGTTVPILVEINEGDRIIGDISIAEESMYVRVISSSGEIISEGIDVTSIHVDYTAEISGTISFAILYLFGTGNPAYYLSYTIYPLGSTQPPVSTTIPPPTTTTAFDATDLPIWVWLIGFYCVLAIFIVFAVIRNKNKRNKDHNKGSKNTTTLKDIGDTTLIEAFPKECKRCKGTGKIKRGEVPIQRGGETEMREIYYECLICGGTGWVD